MSTRYGGRPAHGLVVRGIAAGIAVVVAAGLLSDVAFASPTVGQEGASGVVESGRVVKGGPVSVKPRKTDPPGKPLPPVVWPKPGSVEVVVPGVAAGRSDEPLPVRAGDLSVSVGTTPVGKQSSAGGGRVRVAVLDRAATRNAGVDGVIVTMTPVESSFDGLAVRLDYSGFANGFGGAYGNRLRLMRLPACAVTTPKKAECRVATPVGSARNELKSKTLTATITGPVGASEMVVLAAQAGDSSDQGDYGASDLSASAQWQVGEQSGDFGWSYPLRVPPVPGGLAPRLQLGYSSGAVDGRMSNTNNQASWVGDGFDLSPGFIERRYKACADDGAPADEWGNKPGDLCWGYDNATVTWNGRGGELVKADDGSWRLKDDDGTKFERLTSSGRGNGDDDNEYWRVTTNDGVRYYFGYNRLPGWEDGKAETKSVWTVPVFGDDAGEPCHTSGSFAFSWCDQAWRWNLDYVVDPRGSALAHYYKQEINYYGRNLKPADETKYVRGGWLDRIEYGLHSAAMFVKAPARVVFSESERCIPDATFDCDPTKIDTDADKWRDVPWDLNCGSGDECGINDRGSVSPTFWSRKRLTKATTQVLDGAGNHRDVESWSLAHRWGDADADGQLLLDSVQHTGLAASTSVQLPPVTFTYGQAMPNRVDEVSDDIPPFLRYRVGSIMDESGGQIDVNYSVPECVLSDLPTPQTNTKRCFPVYWTPPGREDPIRDWFHKYVTVQVIQTDRTGGAPETPDMVTNYEYLGGAAWHYDTDDGLTKEKYKTWSQWRGYGQVQVKTGGMSGMLTQRETLFLRGMDGDRASPSGGTKTVEVADGEGGSHVDKEAWTGFELKTTVYDRPGGAALDKTVNTPWMAQTAERTRSWGVTTANLTGTQKTHTWTLISGGAWRETETVNTFNATTGLVEKVDYRGDVATTSDDLCIRTSYAQDVGDWKLNFVSEVDTVSVNCGVTNPDRATQLVSNSRTSYDGGAWGAAPTAGNVTLTREASAHNGVSADYINVASMTYDSYGRVKTVTDAAGNTATTSYTDTNGLNTATTTTSPPVVPGNSATSLVTVTAVDPAFGQPTNKSDPSQFQTKLQYDALGRLRKVWLPNRTLSQTPNLEYSYQVSDGAIVAVGVKELNAQGGQKREAFQLFDGWLRPRQTQAPGPNGGRLITDTFYDSRGNTASVYDTYYSTGAAVPALFDADEGNVETQTAYTYDGLNRVTVEQLIAARDGATQEKWHTSYEYAGDRTTVTPPAGGTPATTIVDARGRVVELRQYKAATPTGDYVSTRYTYLPAGQLETVTDTSGNLWRYKYDLRGRKIEQQDPDTNTTTYTYDDRDLLITSKDARDKTTFHKYDPLRREVETREGSATGPLLTSRLYDTVRKGQLTSATRHVNGQPYTMRVDIYDNLYRPIRTSVIIPATEGALGGTYRYGTDFRSDGLAQSSTLPAAGDLSTEVLTHTYDTDDLGRLVRLGGYVTNTLYSFNGKLTQLELSTGGPKAWVTNGYEYGTQRLATSRVERQNIPGVDRDASYKYDDAGNITSISDVSRSGTDTQCFTYDKLLRLSEAWTQGVADCATTPTPALIGGVAPYWHTYGYDDTGNRTSETLHGVAGAADTTRTYTYPAATQPQPHTLTGLTQSGGAGARTDSFTYDNTGKTTGRTLGSKAQTLDWNIEGRIEKITEGSKTTSFLYDADGNRLIRRDPGGTTLYLPNMELRLDNGAATAKTTRYYTYLGQTIAMRTATGVQFLAGDHHGTSELAISATNQILTERRYTPFGQQRAQNGTWPDDKGFIGGTNDPSTGLTNIGARQYDTDIGRFLSIDPIIDHTDPQQMHGYAYAHNNPTTYSDPTGLIDEGGTDENGRVILDPNPGGNGSSGGGGGSSGGSGGGGGSSGGGGGISWGEAKRQDDVQYRMALAIRRVYLDYLKNHPECRLNPGACDAERRAVEKSGLYDHEETYNSMVRVGCGFTSDPHCLAGSGYKFQVCNTHQECPTKPLTDADRRDARVALLILDVALFAVGIGEVALGVRALGRLLFRPSSIASALGKHRPQMGAVPQNAWETWLHVSTKGAPMRGYKGGKTFNNSGKNGEYLPDQAANGSAITYREWDVNPYVKGTNRGGERLVTGSDGSAYYTNDHYKTFTRFQ